MPEHDRSARPAGSAPLPATAPRTTGERPRRLTGTTIAERIRVGEIIGSGGMGVVYAGEHLGLQTPVAIKVLHCGGDARSLDRFRTEARALAKVRHPNIVQVLDFGVTEDGTSYMVSELLDGESADRIVSRHGHLPWRWVLELVRQLLTALEVAHELGVIHRDVKPSNCFCVGFSDFQTLPALKLLDFGVAKLSGTDIAAPKSTQAGEIIGTAAYMSPEQASGGTIDARSDLYSVGATAYELLTGVPLFQGATSVDLLYQHVHATPKPPREINPRAQVPESVTRVVLTAVEKDPARRYTSARAFRDQVDRVLADPGVELAPPASSGRRGVVLAGSTAAVAAAGALWWITAADAVAGRSCADVLAADPDASDGTYMIDPDGEGGDPAFDAHCDMQTDGGGWTLVAKIHRAHAQGLAGAQNFLSRRMNEHLLLGVEPEPGTDPLVSSHGRERLSALVDASHTARFVLLAQDDPSQRAAWYKRIDPAGFFEWFTATEHALTPVCLDPALREGCQDGRILSAKRDLSGANGKVTVLEGMSLAAHGYPAQGDIHVRLSLDDFNHLAGVCSYTFFDESWADTLDGHWGNGLEIWVR